MRETNILWRTTLLLYCILCPVFIFSEDLTFYITDKGIWQYEDKILQTGDDFSKAKSSVFPSLPKDSQILIVMPPHEDMAKMTNQEMKDTIGRVIKAKIQSGITKNVNQFELQLIEHIGPITYVDKSQQDAVNKMLSTVLENVLMKPLAK